MRPTIKIKEGQKIGNLETIFPIKEQSGNRPRIKWVCICSCGVIKSIDIYALAYNKTFSCGCYAKRINTKHGCHNNYTYQSWANMLRRCRNKSAPGAENYIGRGIIVCERWLQFENFLADMGDRPEGKSLDRINNNGNYEPGNCRWASQKEQMDNTRRNRLLTYNGETKNLTEWARIRNLNVATIYRRLHKRWDMEKVLRIKQLKTC